MNKNIDKQTIKKHYNDLSELIKAFGKNSDKARLASKGPSSGWYEYPDGYDDGEVKRPRYLTSDFEELARVAAIPSDGDLPRSIYTTLNFINKDDKNKYKKKRDEDQDWSELDCLPSYSEIQGFNLFADVDIKDDKKQDRGSTDVDRVVEKAVRHVTQKFRELAPNSVYVLDSGGGFYPFIHHKTLQPICSEFEGDEKGEIIQEVMNRFNQYLKEIEEEMNDELIGVQQVLKIDKINNKNRLFKVPGSIHRSLDTIVHPMDQRDPNFEKWSVPLDDEQIEILENWIQDYNNYEADNNDLTQLINNLFPGYDGDWKERLQDWREEKQEKLKKEREKREAKAKSVKSKLEHVKGYPITNDIQEIYNAIESIDCRNFAKQYDCSGRGDGSVSFNPPWRHSESKRGAFATATQFTDRESMETGDAATFKALEEGLIASPSETLSDKKWFKALDLLREDGYEIPIFIPDAEDSEYNSMPHSAIQKAAQVFGIINSRSELKHVVRKRYNKKEDEMEEKEYFWLKPADWNQTIRKLRDKGFKVNREKKYFSMPEKPGKNGRFIPKLLADDIKEEFEAIATLKDYEKGFEQIHYYENGIYKPGGDAIIKELAREKLGDKATNNYVRQVLHQIKETSYIDIDKFNNSENEIAVENGILNLDTGELRDFDSDFLTTRKIPVKYDPSAECPEIKKFIGSIVDTEDKKRTLQEFCGHAVSPSYPLRKALLCYGETGNGKTVFLDLIGKLLGERNVSGESLHDLCGNTRFNTYNLYGKLANIDPDLSKSKLRDTGTFKSLTGGDRVIGEKKGEQGFTFKNKATLLFSCNNIPKTEDKSPAFYNRWIIIEFPYRFVNEPEDEFEKQKEKKNKLMTKLTTDEELSGFLNWVIKGLKRIKQRNRFTIDPSIEEIKRIYEMGSNNIYEFKEEVLLTKKRAREMLHEDEDIWSETGLEVVKETEQGKEITNENRKWIEPRDRVWKAFNDWAIVKGKDVEIEDKSQFNKDLNRVPEIRMGKARIGDRKQSGKNKGNRKERKVWKKVRIKPKWLSDYDIELKRNVPKKDKGAIEQEPEEPGNYPGNREKINKVKEYLIKNSNDKGEIKISDIEIQGINDIDLNQIILNLKKEGDVFIPKHGKIRLTEER